MRGSPDFIIRLLQNCLQIFVVSILTTGGHQALVCTHPDGHNGSGNVHVHIVINSLRIMEVPFMPYMDRPCDTQPGMKHRCTNAAMEYFRSEVMEMCHDAGLYQIDLLNGSKSRVTAR